MVVDVFNMDGQKVTTVELSPSIFEAPVFTDLMHQAYVRQMANARLGTHDTKTRNEVSGGGRKPWRQKGTGRARAGSIRSPIWRGGGKVFAARPQDHSQKVNRKMYRGAMRCILSELIRQGRLVVCESFALELPRTKGLLVRLKELDLRSVLIVSEEIDENLYLASRNLKDVDVSDVSALDPVSLISHEKVLVTVGALKKLEEALA